MKKRWILAYCFFAILSLGCIWSLSAPQRPQDPYLESYAAMMTERERRVCSSHTCSLGQTCVLTYRGAMCTYRLQACVGTGCCSAGYNVETKHAFNGCVGF